MTQRPRLRQGADDCRRCPGLAAGAADGPMTLPMRAGQHHGLVPKVPDEPDKRCRTLCPWTLARGQHEYATSEPMTVGNCQDHFAP